MFTTYQPGIPTGTVNLDIDYQNLQTNFTQLNNIFGVDHTPFNLALNSGYHGSIHFVPQSTTTTNPPNNYPPTPPAAVAGVGQLFSATSNDGYASSQLLYFMTGAGNLRQLTSNFTPSANTNGFTFIPGGLTIQWGFQVLGSGSSVSGSLLFATANRNFANNCYNVQTTLVSKTAGGTSSSNNSLFIRTTTVSNLGFSYRYNGESSDFSGFYWMAIGN
jgi:hypothetical protein